MSLGWSVYWMRDKLLTRSCKPAVLSRELMALVTMLKLDTVLKACWVSSSYQKLGVFKSVGAVSSLFGQKKVRFFWVF